MSSFLVSFDGVDTLKVGFNPDVPANGDQVVRDCHTALQGLDLKGGDILKVTGAASLGASMVIAHRFCHLFKAVAVFDPRLQQFIVVISHSPDFRVGDLV